MTMIFFVASFNTKANLLAIWTNQLKSAADRRHEEFDGRKNSVDGKAELYQELNKEMNTTSRLAGLIASLFGLECFDRSDSGHQPVIDVV